MVDTAAHESSRRIVDEVDRARAQEYALLTTLLSRSPDSRLLSRLAGLRGDASTIGVAHTALGEAAGRANEENVAQEYLAVFAGLGQSQLSPYSSHCLTGSLYGHPLARLRETLQNFGIEKAPERSEPEDHAAILCEIMAGLAAGGIAAPAGADRDFFEERLLRWIGRFFFDLEAAEAADFSARSGEPSLKSKRRPLPFRHEKDLCAPERIRRFQNVLESYEDQEKHDACIRHFLLCRRYHCRRSRGYP
jgi:TorA maturation chaperone TorD